MPALPVHNKQQTINKNRAHPFPTCTAYAHNNFLLSEKFHP
jgi:hypothetical protein